jgi:hypothetical protein
MISLTTADLVGAAIACLPGRGSRFFRRHHDDYGRPVRPVRPDRRGGDGPSLSNVTLRRSAAISAGGGAFATPVGFVVVGAGNGP